MTKKKNTCLPKKHGSSILDYAKKTISGNGLIRKIYKCLLRDLLFGMYRNASVEYIKNLKNVILYLDKEELVDWCFYGQSETYYYKGIAIKFPYDMEKTEHIFSVYGNNTETRPTVDIKNI